MRPATRLFRSLRQPLFGHRRPRAAPQHRLPEMIQEMQKTKIDAWLESEKYEINKESKREKRCKEEDTYIPKS